MTTLQVLCRYGDDPSVGNFWVTMDELANALSALQATVPDGPDDGPDDAPPPKYSTYKWRVEAIGGHHDNWTYAALYACDAIPVSGDTHKRALDALAAMTARAEAAEARPTITWIATSDQLPPPELRVLAAHKDGRVTMIIRALYIPRFAVACDYNPDMEWDYDPDTQRSYYPEGWYEAVDNGEYAFVGPLTGTVTHWAKLPKLPQEVQP